MPASIGVNLRVTGHCRQGGRKYMEDFFSVAYQQTEDEKDLEYAFFGIYDGHGGAEAAAFAKEHLMETIIKHKNFWSDYDEDVLRAIKDGYIATHYAMWKEQEKWPRTASGLPSTAGTTASVAFIRRGKIYIGHVGDSGIILGYQEPGCSEWRAKPLTRDHKPENAEEMSRIEQCGGKVVAKSGVPRVVWNRPKIGHQGPVRRSTPIDEIPFLAVARSLGDLWSYNSQINQFIVSPDPDCSVLKIDTNIHRCLIFGTDGLYNMLSPMMAVHIVQQAERHNENAALSDSTYKTWLNPSKLLVERALERWHVTKMRADNTSVVTLMLDPPGPPRAQVLKDRKKNLPERGLRIMTRYDGNNPQENNFNNCDNPRLEESNEIPGQTILAPVPEPIPAVASLPDDLPSNNNNNKEDNTPLCTTSTPEITPVSSSDLTNSFPLKERNFLPKTRESTSFDPRDPLARPSITSDNGKENLRASSSTEDNIQCNEISSSNIEADSSCDEEVEDTTSTSARHNLRSTKKTKTEELSKTKATESETNVKGVKRKLDSVQSMSSLPRKSLRIDDIQKKATETVENERRAFEAEEKLKRLAEKADQARQNMASAPAKLSLAQKILKSKNVNLKKKNLVKRPITKEKLKMVLKTVKRSALPHKLGVPKPKQKEKAVVVANAPKLKMSRSHTKVTASKASSFQRHSKKNEASKASSFQRHSKKNGSLRQRNIKVVAKLNDSKAETDKSDSNKPSEKKESGNVQKNLEKPKSEVIIKISAIPKIDTPSKSEVSQVSSSNVPVKGDSRRSLRSSINKLEPAKEMSRLKVLIDRFCVKEIAVTTLPQTLTTKQIPKTKEPVKTNTLKKRIHQKTVSLRKNMIHSKRK